MWKKEEIFNAFKDLVDNYELEKWLKDKEKITEEELSKFLDEQDIEWIGSENDLYEWIKNFLVGNYGINENILYYFDFDRFKDDLIMGGEICTVFLNGTKYFVGVL